MTYEKMQALINRQLARKEAELLALSVTEYKKILDTVRAELSILVEKYTNADGVLDIDELKRFNRLEDLRKKVEAKVMDQLEKTATNIDLLMKEQYNTAYYGYTWATEQEAGVALKFGVIDPKTLNAVLNNPFLEAAIKEMKTQAREKIGEIFSIGFLEGKSYQSIAANVSDAIGISERRALTIIRTENSRAVETAKVEQYQEMKAAGVKARLKYIAVLDGRTRNQSAKMDGDLSNEEGKFKFPNEIWYFHGQTGHPEWDINDRCTTIQVIEGYEPQLRRTRDEGVIGNMTFEEWADEKGLTENIYGEQYKFE